MRELWKQRLLGLISICTGIASLFIVKEATVALFLIWLGLLFILQKPANKKSSVFLKKISKIRFDILCITFKPPEMPALKVVI